MRQAGGGYDHLVDQVYEDKPAGGHVQHPISDGRLPVEEQVRKEMGSAERRPTDVLTASERDATKTSRTLCRGPKSPSLEKGRVDGHPCPFIPQAASVAPRRIMAGPRARNG